MEESSDFNVETNGDCFLCLKRISTPSWPSSLVKMEVEAATGVELGSFYSVQRFACYLNMNLRKVFTEKGPIPHCLLTKVERSKLKVELCKDCGDLNDTFSKLHRQLEKIEMELNFYVQLAHEKLAISNAKNTIGHAVELKSCNKSIDGLEGKLAIAKLLRKETMEKCSTKLNVAAPQLKLQNLTMKQLAANRLKMKLSSQRISDADFSADPDPCSETIGEVKLETQTPIPTPYDDDDYQGDFNSDFHSDEWSQANVSIEEDDIEMKIKTESLVDPSSGAIGTTRSSPVSKMGKFKCGICSKHFQKKEYLRGHHKSNHMSVRIECAICGMKFRHYTQRRRHLERVHMGKEFKCEVCNKIFTNESSQRRHFRESSCGEGGHLREHTCNLCELKFKRQSDMKKHQKIVHFRTKKEMN